MPNLFATILTYTAPSSNYRGESEENRTVLQKITRGDQLHTVISPESMRNALREIIAAELAANNGGWSKDVNRRRLHDEGQLAVEFADFPDAEKYADDFLFGFMVADDKPMKKVKRPAKRDSVVRMNLAVSVEPYRFDATFHQSPLNAGASPWKNAATSALLHREVSWTAFQYPFALCGNDFRSDDSEVAKKRRRWGKCLLRAIAQLSSVAGGHARALYDMAPVSVVLRLTPALVAGFDSYGFQADGSWRELRRLRTEDLEPREFWLGGALVRDMTEQQRSSLAGAGAHLEENPQQLLAVAADEFFGEA